jgi:hypothetical protein
MILLRKVLAIASNASLIAGAAIGIYAGIKTYLLYRSLPAGMCPIDPNRPWLYAAAALCALSFLLSFFETKKSS